MAELTEKQKQLLGTGLSEKQQAILAGDQSFSFGRDIAEPFNRGAISLLEAPTNLLNLGISGFNVADKALSEAVGGITETRQDLPQIPAQGIRQAAEQLGVIAPEEEQRTGLIPRAAEIAGGGIIPAAGALRTGAAALQTLPAARTGVQNVLAQVAARPGAVAAGDIVASTTAAAGGEVARNFTEDPGTIALAELLGGFSPAVALTGPAVRGARFAAEKTQQAIVPFTQAGAVPRAARRLQSLAGDPELAARQIDPASQLSPARQTGDANLIALENRVLVDDPKLNKIFSDDLQAVRQQLRETAGFGGDPDRPRKLLEVNAAMRAQQAQAKVNALGPDADKRQISRIARESSELALKDARVQERALWGQVDRAVETNLTSSKQVFADEIAGRGRFDNPDDIPVWLRSALTEDDITESTMAKLSQLGFVDEAGNIPAPIRQQLSQVTPTTLQDAQTIRSRVLSEIRAERSLPAPNRNKIRIMGNVENALLDDMANSGATGADRARAFSAALNEKFTQGRVGQILGHERRGGLSVSPEDTLNNIVYGREPATTLQRFNETSSEAANQSLQFIKQSYVNSVATGKNGAIDLASHNRFIKSMRDKGIFNVFPELEAELNSVSSAADAARRLQITDSPITRLSGVDKASLFLNAPAGDEMRFLLRSPESVAVAKNLRAKVGSDPIAVKGLKTSFVDELFRQASNEGVTEISGDSLRRLVARNTPAARALGLNDADLAKLNRTAQQFDLGAAKGTATPKAVIEDTPSAALDLLARWIGARSGARTADRTGSSLVMANAFSQRMRGLLQRLTTDKAQEIVIAAHSDPELFRALLIRPTDTPIRQAQAARILEPWIVGILVTQEGEQ